METILITGGTGFFGKSILSMIKSGFLSNYNFIILSRDPDKFLQNNPEFNDIKNVTYIFGDITNFNYNNYNIDYILHAATVADHKIDDIETYNTIIKGTENILQFALKCKHLKKLLYISSGGVYGKKVLPTNENDICEPFTVYGNAKLLAEKLCLESNLPICIGRCFTFIGKYLPKTTHFAIGNFISNCIKNEPIIIKSDGTSIRSYMYADDLVNWIFTLLFNGKINEIYNIGSNEHISIKDLAYLVKNSLNSKSEIIINNNIDKMENKFYVPDISKCIKEFNLNIKVKLKNAILLSI